MKHVHLGWAASQAVHVWRVAGYSAMEISAGMRVSLPVVRAEIRGSAKKARAALGELTCWAGYMQVGAVVTALGGRKLDAAEVTAVMTWLAIGFNVTSVAEAFRQTHTSCRSETFAATGD